MLDRNRTALVIIDVQENLAAVMDQSERLIDNLSRLIRGAILMEIPILWAEQVPAKLGPTVAALASILSPVATPIEKCAFSCMGAPPFADAVTKTGRDQFVLAGIESHVCVFQTATHLIAKGYEVHVVADGVSSRSAPNRQIGLDRIAREGGVISSVEMALFELSGQAGGDEFRQLVKIVK